MKTQPIQTAASANEDVSALRERNGDDPPLLTAKPTRVGRITERYRSRSWWLRRASRAFGTVPAFAYGIAYLLLIPLFALMYTSLVPGDFHHTTVIYEDEYFSEVASLERQLNQTVIRDLRASFASDVIPLDNGSVLCIDAIELFGLDIATRGYATFQMLAPISTTADLVNNQCVEAGITSIEAFDGSTDFERITGIGGMRRVDPSSPAWLEIALVSTNSEADFTQFFPDPVDTTLFNIGYDRVFFTFSIPPTLQQKIENVVLAGQGSPAGIRGEWGRMIHLSASALTSAGYGDIVPLTNRARLLTASETILGLVLIGLFLNSIAHTRKRTVTA